MTENGSAPAAPIFTAVDTPDTFPDPRTVIPRPLHLAAMSLSDAYVAVSAAKRVDMENAADIAAGRRDPRVTLDHLIALARASSDYANAFTQWAFMSSQLGAPSLEIAGGGFVDPTILRG